MMREL